jgi:hypothetical protein
MGGGWMGDQRWTFQKLLDVGKIRTSALASLSLLITTMPRNVWSATAIVMSGPSKSRGVQGPRGGALQKNFLDAKNAAKWQKVANPSPGKRQINIT